MKKLMFLTVLTVLPMVMWAQKSLPSIEVKDIDGNAVNVQSVLDDGVPVIR